MNILISNRELKGNIKVPVSKSEAHRKLIAAALTGSSAFEGVCQEIGNNVADDIKATMECLNIILESDEPVLDVNESGSTLRFLLPVAAALGKKAVFRMGESLAERPVDGLNDILSLKRDGRKITVYGKLIPGTYHISGKVSSQYVSGMLFALSALEGSSRLIITGGLKSRPYVDMTVDVLRRSGIEIIVHDMEYIIHGKHPWGLKDYSIGGDWSAGAFYLVLKKLGADIEISGLSDSIQGDSRIVDILSKDLDEADLSDIPDLAPALAVYGAGREKGIILRSAERLKVKESDRASGIVDIINSLGGRAEYLDESDGSIRIYGGHRLTGGECDCRKDHRLILMAACLSYISDGTIYIRDAENVSKSYKAFFEDFRSLGGRFNIEV